MFFFPWTLSLTLALNKTEGLYLGNFIINVNLLLN